MGRTMHFNLTPIKTKYFSSEELDTIQTFSKEMNSGVFKNSWTCENLYIQPISWYPNWQSPELQFKTNQMKNVWSYLESKLKALTKSGMTHYSALAYMAVCDRTIYFADTHLNEDAKEHIMRHSDLQSSPWTPEVYELRSFQKIRSNEFNGLMTYLALIDLSKRLPNVMIRIIDEGYLFFDQSLIIQDGKTFVDLNELKKDTLRTMAETFGSLPFVQAQLDGLDQLPELIKSSLCLAPPQNTPQDQTDEAIPKIQENLNRMNQYLSLLKEKPQSLAWLDYSSNTALMSTIFNNSNPALLDPFNFVNIEHASRTIGVGTDEFDDVLIAPDVAAKILKRLSTKAKIKIPLDIQNTILGSEVTI